MKKPLEVPAARQVELLCRGTVDVHLRKELEERIGEGRPLRVKAGFDPTRPDLHVGHTVLISKMRQFQDLGHEVVFLIGDFTAMVGDPTGKNELRPRLTRDEVRAASATYAEQVFKVLDRERTVVRYNSEWLDRFSPTDFIELAAKYTVARMLERDDFSRRMADERPIFVHELMYPLLQAYDSVALECDVELGGTDQLFNLLVGRDIMGRYGKRPQMVMTTPILEGLDARFEDGKIVGAKMSKSADNYVGIDEPPATMLQKLMLIDDRVLPRFIELLSRKTPEEAKHALDEVATGKQSIIDLKEQFALELVERFHGREAADAALARRRAVSAGEVPADVEEVVLTFEGDELWIAKALALAKLVKSTSEGVSMVKGGGVRLDGEKVDDPQLKLRRGASHLVRVGSKNKQFRRLRLG
jgi:tyrosyl-tRNA synthetase